MSRALVLIAAIGLTFAVMRAYLHLWPDTDLNVAGYDVHHLFTGLVVLTLGGLPAVLLPRHHRLAPLAIGYTWVISRLDRSV